MNADRPKPRVFLSHNSADKKYASRLAGALQLAGASVWFDAWKIRPGDSIPEAVNKGLADLEIFVLLWSSSAAKSRWVESEANAAVTRLMKNDGCRIIPVVLDEADLPALVSHLRFVSARDQRAPIEVAKDVLGIESEKALLVAVQEVINEAGVAVREFWGAGVFVCCPKCGASVEYLRGWQSTDYGHDRSYAGAECTACGWNDGSEM